MGVVLKYQKHPPINARNCMKCTDLYGKSSLKTPFPQGWVKSISPKKSLDSNDIKCPHQRKSSPHSYGGIKYQKNNFFLGIAGNVQICTEKSCLQITNSSWVGLGSISKKVSTRNKMRSHISNPYPDAAGIKYQTPSHRVGKVSRIFFCSELNEMSALYTEKSLFSNLHPNGIGVNFQNNASFCCELNEMCRSAQKSPVWKHLLPWGWEQFPNNVIKMKGWQTWNLSRSGNFIQFVGKKHVWKLTLTHNPFLWDGSGNHYFSVQI